MERTKIKKFVIIIASVIALPMLIWYAAVPDSAVQGLLASRTADNGLGIETTNFHKGLFFSFGADGVSVKIVGKEALVFNDLHGRINPLALFLFRLHVPLRARLAQGTVNAVFDYGLISGQKKLQARFDGVQIGALPPVKRSVSGLFNANLVFLFSAGKGNLLFTMDRLGNFPYGFKSANGAIGITRSDVSIESVSLEAPDTYAKVKGSGNLENGSYNLSLEITRQGGNPEPALGPFEKSPGYYVIPLSGRLKQFF